MLSYKSVFWSKVRARTLKVIGFSADSTDSCTRVSLLVGRFNAINVNKKAPSALLKRIVASVAAYLLTSLIASYAIAQQSLPQVPSLAQEDPNQTLVLSDQGYRLPSDEDSEFNNYSDEFVADWRKADPEHEDTEFGELIYNEASAPTKLEILRLLSKDTPSIVVFLHAIAMGINIEDVLQASVKYEPNKSPDLAASAVALVPVLGESNDYVYSGYELEDLEREDEEKPYLVADVVDKFFKDRLVLRPYPDWFDGQYHFLASAAELKTLQEPQKEVKWYRTKSTQDIAKRPVFVSLYEATESVLIDSEERIAEALAQDPNALLPVVFIFNRLNERAIDQLGYSPTIRGVQEAYVEKSLMVTPSPEWQLGEYHTYAAIDEFYEVFDLPEEEDFEPEAWQELLAEAEDYSVTNTAFLIVVLGDENQDDENQSVARSRYPDGTMLAAWDDPRADAEFKYVQPEDSSPVTLKTLLGKGLVLNRPDLIAALKALGVQRVPVAYYYVDSSRVYPYVKNPRGLINAANGVITRPPSGVSGGGVTPCASPPCVDQ